MFSGGPYCIVKKFCYKASYGSDLLSRLLLRCPCPDSKMPSSPGKNFFPLCGFSSNVSLSFALTGSDELSEAFALRDLEACELTLTKLSQPPFVPSSTMALYAASSTGWTPAVGVRKGSFQPYQVHSLNRPLLTSDMFLIASNPRSPI